MVDSIIRLLAAKNSKIKEILYKKKQSIWTLNRGCDFNEIFQNNLLYCYNEMIIKDKKEESKYLLKFIKEALLDVGRTDIINFVNHVKNLI